MPPVATADIPPSKESDFNKGEVMKDQSDALDSNHDLPARTIREDQHEQPQPPKDDPATVAASEELKHTSISDKVACETEADLGSADVEAAGEDKDMKASTPDGNLTDAQDEEMRERLSSPKKKRGRDQDEDEDKKDSSDDRGDDPTSSADGSVVNGNRTTRSEPEKKRRPRDTSQDLTNSVQKGDIDLGPANPAKTSLESPEAKMLETEKLSSAAISKENPQTSASAFASSGFASLAASSTSPFGSLGATKPSVFGGGNSQIPTSGFGALTTSSSVSTSTSTALSGFGALGGKIAGGFSFGGGTSSGFGGLGSGSVFGSKLGNGFAGGAGPKLSSFAAPGKDNATEGSKPVKAFGAPESDDDGDSDDEGSDGDAATDDEESARVALEDKKKGKITKVHVDDGEAGEATLLQMRAKLFALEFKEVGWKERGVGTLKINVPKTCVSYDDNGAPIPGSFDASGLEDEESQSLVARLIMRQENTHRVILNTVILGVMEFQEKPAASSAQLLFTAFEGEKEPKPVNMLLKMSEANARLFRSEIDSIQRELSF